MRLISQSAARQLRLLFALACVALVVRDSQAADELRWKFNVGDKLNYNMVQDMSLEAGANPVGKMNMRQEMDMHWKVEGVDDAKQEAIIKQKFNRIKMKMSTALGGFEYDSKSEAPPTGPAAMIAPLYKAMTEGEFEIVMTSRGEIKDVKIPQEVIDAFKNSPGAGQMGEMASPEGFKKMISQGALVLPENAPKEGEKWTTTITINNPQVGKQTVDTTYTYSGTKEIDGVTYAVIKPELKMEFGNAGAAEGGEAKDQPQQPGAPQFQMKIVKQESEGEILFNVDEGRLHTSTLGQKATIDIKAGGQSVQQNIEQKIDVKVTPDTGEAAPESDSTEKSTEKDKEAKSEDKSK